MLNKFVVIIKDGKVAGVYSNDLEANVEVVDVTNATKEEKDVVAKKIENLYDVG